MALRTLQGGYAYTLQGLMYVGNTENGNKEAPHRVRAGLALDTDKRRAWPEDRQLWALPISEPNPLLNPALGYYPYSEAGTMRFNNDGTLKAVFWLSVAGYSTLDALGGAGGLGDPGLRAVDGRYQFYDRDPFLPDSYAGDALPMGLITIWFRIAQNQPEDNFLWDYTFVMVSDDEIKISVAGRLPRPVTATGTMKRMVRSAFKKPMWVWRP